MSLIVILVGFLFLVSIAFLDSFPNSFRTTLNDQPLPSNQSLFRISPAIFWAKQIHKYERLLNNFLLQNKSFQSPKSTKK